MAEEEPISSKISRLNQLVQGKLAGVPHRALVSRDGLLDALLALYEECTHTALRKNQYVADFVKKYSKTVDDIKRLRICIKDFEVKNTIGRGHFGEVKVVREKCTGDVYALKILRKDDTLAQSNVSFYEEERDIMSRTHSVWHTQLQYAFQDPASLYLVMEFHPGGDLLSLLARYDDVFEEGMARFYLAEMVLAVHALHTMGYVHRDVKPENVLIDRTGHIKLADFGSACRLNDGSSTCANMPVGTPDYISPETLARMNSDHTTGKFGVECDWWSLGVCAYEMLYGSAPFTASSGHLATTYSNIINFKKCLKLPDDAGVSRDAEHLLTHLLTDAEQRLTYDKLAVHAFFAKLDFDNIRSARPPFIPTVTSSDDVSNFEEFSAAKPRVHVESGAAQGFTGKHLPFIGFTFTKCIPLSDKASVSEAVASPACKNSLERRLASKSGELQEIREKCKHLEDREAHLHGQVRTLETKLLNRDGDVQRLETERDALERSMAHYVTENKSLQRQIEYEKEQKASDEKKALTLIEQITRQQKQLARMQHEEELEDMNRLIEDMEREKEALERKMTKMEREKTQERTKREQAESKMKSLQTRLDQWAETSRLEVADSCEEVEALRQQLASKDKWCRARVQQVEADHKAAMTLAEEMRDCKNNLEKELLELRMGRTSEALVRKKLFASEERRKSLESELQRLQLMERREEHMRAQLEEKTRAVRDMAATLSEMEERLESREIEYKKCERIYSQREEQHLHTIHELEEELVQARCQKNVFEESSMLAFEDMEEKEKIIHDQECTISQMRGNLNVLEEQVSALKAKVEKSGLIPRRNDSPRKSRRSGAVQTLPSPSRSPDKKVRRVAAQAQTDSALNRSGCTQTDEPSSDRLSGGCQTEASGMESALTQTSFCVSRGLSPKRVSFQCQAEENEERKPESQSNLTQTSPSKEKDRSDGLTSISVKVKVRQRSSERGQGDRDDSLTSVTTDDTSLMTSESGSPDSSVTSQESDRPKVIGKVNMHFWEDKAKQKKTKSPAKTPKGKVSQKTWTPKVTGAAEKWSSEVQTEGANTASHAGDTHSTRKLEEQVSDLKQDKIYLEFKVDSLEDELQKVKVNKDEQRIRALDLKHELSERTRHYENKLDELRQEVSSVKLTASEATASRASWQQLETSLKARLEKCQQELDKLRIDSRLQTTKLQDERDDLDSSLKVFKSRCERMEENESLIKKVLDETEADLHSVTEKYMKLAPRSKEMEAEVKRLQEEKTRSVMELDRVKAELADTQRTCEKLTQQVSKLREVCAELERQVTDYDNLNREYEQRQTALSSDRGAIEKQAEEQQEEISTLRKQLEREKQCRQKAEEKREELHGLLTASGASYAADTERMRQAVADGKTRINILNHQLTQMERERSLVEVDNKNLKRRLDAVLQDDLKLKEEISMLITRTSELKSSNLRLSKSLEDAMDRYHLLASQNTDLQNTLDTLTAGHEHERYKLRETGSQQAKLIDYLQTKVENPHKKKKGIFLAGRREDQPASLQLREAQHSLEHEREKNAALQREVIRLKDELHQRQTEVTSQQPARGRRFVASDTPSSSSGSAYFTPSSTPTQRALQEEREAILGNLMLSPNNKPGPEGYQGGSMSVPKTTRRVKKERARPGRPHRFTTGLNSKATNCAVCLGSVLFVKQAAKCDDCKMVCHPACVAHVLTQCGSATDYSRQYADTLRQARTTPTMRLSVAGLQLYMSSSMKVPRPGKQLWEKRYVVLKDNAVQIHAREQTGQAAPLDSFLLCPQGGAVSVHSAVTAAELPNTSSADLPYIFRLEFEAVASAEPGRSLYLMALNFADKHKWVATLEAIVNHSGKADRLSNARVLGNMILSLSKRRLEINCTLPLHHHDVLVGTDEGLYLLELNKTADSRSFIKIEGVASVALMSLIPSLGKIVMVTGKARDLVAVDVAELQARRHDNPPTVTPTPVAHITTVTTFAWADLRDGVHVTVATADELGICVLRYSQSNRAFVVKQEMLISEPCACMYMGQDCVIYGADKFYHIDLRTYHIKELLDKSDMSLAFAVYGAAHYESFPIQICHVSPPQQPDEFLLCFHEFGVFVDGAGRRSRDEDLKWSGLPLMFAYRKPYLYTVHFNTLHVTEILPRGSPKPEGLHTMLNLPGPRYLGPALASGAVYIASLHDCATEIVCFRGNMADARDHGDDEEVLAMKENVPVYPAPPPPLPYTDRSVKKQAPLAPLNTSSNSEASEFVSPHAPTVSPPKINHLSGSPVSRRRRNSDTSVTSEESTSSSTVTSLRQTFDAESYRARKEQESYQRVTKQGQSGGASTPAHAHAQQEPCHKTIRTLKQVLAEQSRQRRGYGNPQHNT